MSIDLTGDYVLGIEGLYGSPTIQASLSVSEVRRGTAQPLGLDSRGENAGAAFVFKRVPVDATIYASGGAWVQEARLSDVTGFVGDRFGWSVDVLDDGTT
jgi:hypothetical protein